MTYEQLVRNVEPMVRVLMENGFRYFACGGALGFDTFAATYICSLKHADSDGGTILYFE